MQEALHPYLRVRHLKAPRAQMGLVPWWLSLWSVPVGTPRISVRCLFSWLFTVSRGDSSYFLPGMCSPTSRVGGVGAAGGLHWDVDLLCIPELSVHLIAAFCASSPESYL